MKVHIHRILLALVCICATCMANAQFRYGVVAGPTLTNLHFKQDIVTIKQTPGMQMGLQCEMMFPGIGFGIDFGFIYNMAGAKVNLGERLMWQVEGYGDERIMLHQINLPFHLRFKYTNLNGLEDIIAPFVYGGPDFNINVAHSHCDAMSFTTGDLGLTAGIGAEIHKRWQISGSYCWGMTYSLKAKILQNYSATTRQWTLRVAYFF